MSKLSANNKPSRRRLAAIALGSASVGITLFIVGTFMGAELVKLAGFMVGASTFLPFPADAYILSMATKFGPLSVALVAGSVNAVVVLVEAYWIRQAAAIKRFETLHRFLGSSSLVAKFNRHQFLGLVLGGASPLPFEPFRFLAALSKYSNWRFALATFIGRGARYYAIVALGSRLLELGYFQYVLWGFLAVFAVGLVRSYFRFKTLTAETASVAEKIVGAPDTVRS